LARIESTDLNSPNPALVTHRAAQRLPRIALLLFCAAYVLPGLLGRDPWKSADITAFGYMLSIAQGRTSWLEPTVGGLPADSALLPYWIGAAFIRWLGPWVDPALAARIPFALLLVLVLVLVWYATYYLARDEAAQPLPLAFGGEATPIDYARAIADGALLALIASLGLLQLGHETTPELVQLVSVALFLYALAAMPFRVRQARLAVMLALPALAASGAPSIAIILGVVAAIICRLSPDAEVRRTTTWVWLSAAAAALVAGALGAWAWRLGRYESVSQIGNLLRQLVWFTWPAWPLALWTLWRWRLRLLSRHIVYPLACVAVALGACISMGGSDRALMLGLPALAVLAAFALPTLQRSTAAAIDWFSVFFFSIAALTIWVIYVSMQTGIPAKPAANIARLATGYAPSFSVIALVLAIAGSAAWIWLVHWRTRRSRHPLWKSMVLPASGVTLCWLLVMTLLLPPLDHARSYRSLVTRIANQVPRDACIAAPGMSRAQVVALEYLGGYRVDAKTPATLTSCPFLLLMETRQAPAPAVPGWQFVARERRNTNDEEVTAVYRRTEAPG
jgi:4-amino-4-deoxy-L-arabinose transferase-like glycosyltransferase